MSAHVLDRLSMYLDGELAAPARSEVEAHLRGCAACARHLEELAAVDAAARELPVPAPTGYFDSLPARVRARLPAPRRRAPPVWVWAAAAGLALAALAPVLLRQTTSPVPEGTRTDDEVRVAPPPTSTATTAPAAPAEAPPAGGARERVLSKEAVRTKAAPPAPAPPPVLLERATENAARAPAVAPAPSAPQIQKHNGPWAQAPPAAARAEQARAEKVPAEEAPAGAPKDAQRDAGSEGKAEPDQARRGLTDSVPTFAPAPTEETRYRALLARRPASAGEDRQLHDAWRAFAASYPASPRADEARVRALDALLSAYLREGQARDRERLREEAGLYLLRSDAAQASRVHAILESAGLD